MKSRKNKFWWDVKPWHLIYFALYGFIQGCFYSTVINILGEI